jgi:hypothetical protein
MDQHDQQASAGCLCDTGRNANDGVPSSVTDRNTYNKAQSLRPPKCDPSTPFVLWRTRAAKDLRVLGIEGIIVRGEPAPTPELATRAETAILALFDASMFDSLTHNDSPHAV